jgi:hypothetical protein
MRQELGEGSSKVALIERDPAIEAFLSLANLRTSATAGRIAKPLELLTD